MLGIAGSKATLVCTLIDPHDQQVCWETTVPNTVTGIARLVQRTAPRVRGEWNPRGGTAISSSRTPTLPGATCCGRNRNGQRRFSPPSRPGPRPTAWTAGGWHCMVSPPCDDRFP